MDRNTAMQAVKLILRFGFNFVHKDQRTRGGKKKHSGHIKVVGRNENAEAHNGDMVQAIKYFTQSFEAVRGLLTPEATISGACSYEESQGSEPHQRPLRHGIKLMDQMGKCYHHLWRHEPAEKLLKKVMRLYEKYHGEFSENAPSRSNDRGIA
ncbi:Ryanodine-inositol 1,4,5-triphosphate receptor Ca2 channel (RIR-CaC) family protein [Phytophthora cinnamomi]|uniref:Ryanodine-inositol 1,4,5-triphosphate receptor Ca2 channel (RIR-CaC) family protein n=1 Tax=Phytophthora cinnamomi TaxID=4785 RepID=UPI00355A0638|nr:Ryanodine-inositol 1,4,5-triphosphate receptor Ca2 channel (RIR-CaC) family protein [Phytophthora cinnamomi]